MKFKWVVQFEVDKYWVADGFNLTNEKAHDMLWNTLQSSAGYELKAKVIASPDPDKIARAQGYKSATDCKKRGHTL